MKKLCVNKLQKHFSIFQHKTMPQVWGEVCTNQLSEKRDKKSVSNPALHSMWVSLNDFGKAAQAAAAKAVKDAGLDSTLVRLAQLRSDHAFLIDVQTKSYYFRTRRESILGKGSKPLQALS